jgi:hypothetical protein
MPMMIFIPFRGGPPIVSPALEPGGNTTIFVADGTANGTARSVLVLLSMTNETVCGSPTSVGLY